MIVVPAHAADHNLHHLLNTAQSWIKTAIVLLAVPFSLVGRLSGCCIWPATISASPCGSASSAASPASTPRPALVMLLYLDLAYDDWRKKGLLTSTAGLRDAIYHGAVKRVRPKAMTAAVIIAGLLPILWSHGAGADIMKRIATPMVGGIMTSTIMELMVYPAIFYVWRQRRLPPRPPWRPGPEHPV